MPAINIVDRHRFDADPDPTFHFAAYPDPDPTPSFTHVGISDFFDIFYSLIFLISFIYSTVSLHIFIFLVSVLGALIFNILDSIIQFSGKN
jgi:uncharacterized membrane protein